MKCPNCSCRIKKSEKYCSQCGTELNMQEINIDTNKKPEKKVIFIGIGTLLVVGIISAFLFSSLNKCKHEWSEPTCTVLSTCKKCGETQGELASHDWIAASCEKPKTCSICSLEEGEPLGHTWTDANCSTPKTCTKCNITDGTALGHTSGEICTRCGYCDETLAINNAKAAIHVYGIDLKMNSVGGIDTYITWKNNSQKEIKYINFHVQYYNNVGDVIPNDIGGNTTTRLSGTGPFPTDKGMYCPYSISSATVCYYFTVSQSQYKNDESNGWAGQYWQAPFYNTTTKYIKIAKIEIAYMDGSNYTIANANAISSIIGNGNHIHAWNTNDTGDNYLR